MSSDVVQFDPDLDMDEDYIPDGPPEPVAQTAEQPDTTADTSQAAEGEAAQPHEQEAKVDPEFAKQDTFKDPGAWASFTNTLATVLGKTPEEVTALPFAQRMEALEELKGLPERLEKLADFENFVGIVVDKPAEQWDVGKQLEELPPNHYNKLVDTVLESNIENFTRSVLANPAEHADSLPILQTAAGVLMETVYSRPVTVIDQIMEMTQGMTPQQIQAALSGQPQQAPFATPNVGGYTAPPTGQVSQAAQLQQQAQVMLGRAQQMVDQGWELTSPEVQYLDQQARQLWQTGQALAQQERQFQQVQAQLQQVQTTFGKQEQTTKEQATRDANAKVDSLATQARNGVLDVVTKGRIPDGKDHVKKWIARDAEAELAANPRAQAALELAKNWQVDGQEAKAKQHLAVYTQLADKAYKQAAHNVLSELVTGTQALRESDQKKAARREITTSAGAATNNSLAPDSFKDLQIGRQDPGELALREYQRRKALSG